MALAEQCEFVRREELPQLPVGEQTRVRGIACGLELVERGGRGRVVRRELVDDEHAAAGPRHPRELGDDALGLRDVMERAVRAREVEGAVGKRQRRPVSLDELGVRQGPRPRELEQLGHGVEPDDLPHERGEGERQRARAGADVESALVSAQLDEVAHLLREPRRAGVLVRRDALRRAGEAVSRQTTRRARAGSELIPQAIS